jgi:hypothetical protein
MGTLLPFRANVAARAGREAQHRGDAAIIIFPGVRYERAPELADRPKGSGGRAAKPTRKSTRAKA